MERIQPPVEPYHVLAQQLMALALQEQGIGRHIWLEWVRAVPAFAQMPADQIDQVVQWMLERGMLWEDQGILGIGRQGEETYGRRHFMELFSVFLSPPLFAVLHGRQELGFVDELTFLGKQDGPRTLLLGGRAWRVTHVDWQRKVAYVEASQDQGRSRWKGAGQGLSFRLSQAIKDILASDESRTWWSQRAQDQMTELRDEFTWLAPEGTVAVSRPEGKTEWWTFAGDRANACLAPMLAQATQSRITHDSFTLKFEQHLSSHDIERAIASVRDQDATGMLPNVDEAALDGLKFSECLPVELATEMLRHRIADAEGANSFLHQPVRFVGCGTIGR